MGFPDRVKGVVGIYERWNPRRHTDALAELGRDAEVMRFLGGPQPRGVSAEVSRRIADHWATFGFGLWACLDPDDERCLGFSGVCRPGPQWSPPYGAEIELGWRLARDAWGRGVATEGARLAAAALAATGRRRVIAFIHPENAPSVAVAGRLGMRRFTEAIDPRLSTRIDVYELALGGERQRAPVGARVR